MIQGLLRVCLGVAVAVSGVVALAAEPGIESTYAAHTRGVQLARAGRYDDGLAVLRPLLERFPDDYALVRDVVLINTWKGDCDAALEYFARIRGATRLDDYLIDPVAECAATRARAGEYDRGRDTLAALLPHARDDYPLRRDLALIAFWSGDCAGALTWFDPIRDDARNPPYLLVPMSTCLLRARRFTEALAVTEAGLGRYPGDSDLRLARTRAQVALLLAGRRFGDRTVVTASAGSNNSDRGAREWLASVEASAPVADQTRVYGRYRVSRAEDSALAPGDMNRFGAGVRWRPTARLLLDQGFSSDVDKSGLGGSHTQIEYKPYDAWTAALGHDSYAEDVSVRARANGVKADRTYATAEYESLDYVWYGRAAANRYDFTDTNRRTDFFGTAGYAYELLAEREQRVFVEYYQSRNTVVGAPYFNPRSDRSVGLAHRIDFVFDSRFKRHVDHLYLSAGSYWQEDFGTHGRWGVRYEQDYDFDSTSALLAGIGFQHNVYDGQPEGEWRIELVYRKEF